MALVPLTARKRPVTWQDLFDMTDILSAYVSSATAEIATVSGSSRDLCVALDPLWVQVTWFSQRAWSSMAVPVCVYASQPLRVGLLSAGWFRNDWHVPNVLY